MTTVRAGVAQVRAPRDTADAIKRVAEIASAAANDGVALVVFPEALLGGYPRGAGFGAVVGERSGVGREEFLAYSGQAVTCPVPSWRSSATSLPRGHCTSWSGSSRGPGPACTAPRPPSMTPARSIGRRRKVMPTGSERLIWAQGDGSTLTVTDTRLGRVATAICWENLMPALRLNFYAQGVDIWCAPTADARDVQLATMRHIAVEGRCFVLTANQVARVRDLSPSYATTYTDGEQIVCRGASVIVDPFGEVLAGPLLDQEGLLVADLDLDDVTRGRYDFDASGHYSRPDIFTLLVDRASKPSVTDD